MTAQVLAIAAGIALAALMASQDYRQTRTPESFVGALLTFGLVATVAVGIGSQA
jgi:hypothetical protein